MSRTINDIMTPEIEKTMLRWIDEDLGPAAFVEWLGPIQDYLVWILVLNDIGDEPEHAKMLKMCINDIIVIREELSKLLPAGDIKRYKVSVYDKD